MGEEGSEEEVDGVVDEDALDDVEEKEHVEPEDADLDDGDEMSPEEVDEKEKVEDP